MAPTDEERRIHRIAVRNKLRAHFATMTTGLGLASLGIGVGAPLSRGDTPTFGSLALYGLLTLTLFTFGAACIISIEIEK